MSQTTILLLIVILLSISSITILLLTRLHLRKINKEDINKTILTAKSLRLSSYKAWSREIQQEREDLWARLKSENINIRNAYLKKFYEKKLYLYDFDLFVKLVDSKIDHYISNLMVDFPKLSSRDLQLIILYLLSVSENDILIIFDYSQSSLPTIKNRLCHKLNISRASNLHSYLESRV